MVCRDCDRRRRTGSGAPTWRSPPRGWRRRRRSCRRRWTRPTACRRRCQPALLLLSISYCCHAMFRADAWCHPAVLLLRCIKCSTVSATAYFAHDAWIHPAPGSRLMLNASSRPVSWLLHWLCSLANCCRQPAGRGGRPPRSCWSARRPTQAARSLRTSATRCRRATGEL